jgi:dihydrofolate synthase/folylpolyglutamate synthase
MRQTEHYWRQKAAEVEHALLQRMPENKLRPRLEPTRRAVELLGDPQHAYRVIHVTGTNGKTSTTRFIERILREMGLRTGRFTSPHLLAINERIAIDGDPVDNETLATAWLEIEPILKLVDDELTAAGESTLTYFETLSVLAFVIFADAPIDVLALEVGMGGEWDSTNVADGDVAVFTPIALDHTERLGDTLSAIATTKSGIIKPGSRVIIGLQTDEALKVLVEKAGQIADNTYLLESDFSVLTVETASGAQRFSVRGLASDYEDLLMPVLGDFQAENAAVAIAAIEAFFGDEPKPIARDVLRAALADVSSPGRLQIIDRSPLTILDAAHNPAGITALVGELARLYPGAAVHAVVGVLAEKDAAEILHLLAPVVKSVTLTTTSSPRALPVETLSGYAVAHLNAQSIQTGETVAEAFDRARGLGLADPNSLVLVTGSISLVADVLKLQSETEDDDA